MGINGHTPLCEDYVSYEIAKLLKEKGFDNEVKSYYVYDSEFKTWELEEDDRWDTPNNWGSYYCSAPTLQMAMKWLREKNDIAIEINVGSGSKDCWVSNVIKDYKTENGTYIQTFVKFSYEEACEAAIRYILENLI